MLYQLRIPYPNRTPAYPTFPPVAYRSPARRGEFLLWPSTEESAIAELRDTVRALTEQLGKVIVGQRKKSIEQTAGSACGSRGHCPALLGVARDWPKTLLVQGFGLARILDLFVQAHPVSRRT